MCSFEQKISEEVTASRSERRKDMSLGAGLSDAAGHAFSRAEDNEEKKIHPRSWMCPFRPDSSATGFVFPSLNESCVMVRPKRLMPGSYGIVRHSGDSNTCVTTPLGVADKLNPYEGAEVGLTSVRDVAGVSICLDLRTLGETTKYVRTWDRALKWTNGI